MSCQQTKKNNKNNTRPKFFKDAVRAYNGSNLNQSLVVKSALAKAVVGQKSSCRQNKQLSKQWHSETCKGQGLMRFSSINHEIKPENRLYCTSFPQAGCDRSRIFFVEMIGVKTSRQLMQRGRYAKRSFTYKRCLNCSSWCSLAHISATLRGTFLELGERRRSTESIFPFHRTGYSRKLVVSFASRLAQPLTRNPDTASRTTHLYPFYFKVSSPWTTPTCDSATWAHTCRYPDQQEDTVFKRKQHKKNIFARPLAVRIGLSSISDSRPPWPYHESIVIRFVDNPTPVLARAAGHHNCLGYQHTGRLWC